MRPRGRATSTLIPLPGELPREVFEQHLVKAASIPPSSPSPAELIDAETLEQRTGIPASWWMTQARERRVPFRKLGRYVRFDFSEVVTCDAYQRRAIDTVGQRAQRASTGSFSL